MSSLLLSLSSRGNCFILWKTNVRILGQASLYFPLWPPPHPQTTYKGTVVRAEMGTRQNTVSSSAVPGWNDKVPSRDGQTRFIPVPTLCCLNSPLITPCSVISNPPQSDLAQPMLNSASGFSGDQRQMDQLESIRTRENCSDTCFSRANCKHLTTYQVPLLPQLLFLYAV